MIIDKINEKFKRFGIDKKEMKSLLKYTNIVWLLIIDDKLVYTFLQKY